MPVEILLLLLVIHLPFLMPGWRSFLVLLALCLALGIGVGLGVHFFAADEVPRVLLRIGNIWLDVLRWCLPVTLAARALVLGARSAGLRLRWRVVLTLLGLLALPGWVLGNVLMEGWKRRPAPAECSEHPVPVQLAGMAGELGWNHGISLYLGPVLRVDGRYMNSPQSRRQLCRETANGAEALRIRALSLRVEVSAMRCRAPDLRAWERSLCLGGDGRDWHHLQAKVFLFDPAGIRPGDFGIPPQATDGAVPVGEGEFMVTVEDPAGSGIGLLCRRGISGEEASWCVMRRDLREGLSFAWSATLPRATFDEDLRRMDGFARAFCAETFGAGVCDLPGR